MGETKENKKNTHKKKIKEKNKETVGLLVRCRGLGLELWGPPRRL